MGPKNRNLRPQPSKPAEPRKPATSHGGGIESQKVNFDPTGGGAPLPLPQENDPLDPTSAIYSSIREECRKAIALLKQNNKHSEVLWKTMEICENHPNSALAQCAQAYVHQQTAYVMAAAEKQRHLRAAVETARRAAAMSPNSIRFAAYYATLLFETFNREEGVRECDRALSIFDPIDPALEKLADETESGEEKSTKEARIKRFKKNLCSLPQTFDGSTPIPPPVVEPPDGKKAVEEMTGKLLAQQAAQGILRAPSDLIPSPSETDDDSGDEGQGEVGVHNPRNLKVEKHYQQLLLDRVVNLAKKVTESKSYWDSLSEEEKKKLLQLSIEDLRKHLASMKDGGRLAAEIWSEGIGFAQKNTTWKAFSCFFCDKRFIDLESLLNHIKKKHERVAAHDFLQFIPQEEADASRFELLDIKKQIVFTSDSSCLLLDDHFRDEETGVEEPADSNALMHWLHGGFTIKEELEKWGAQQVGAKQNGEDAFQMFEKQYDSYQRLSKAKLGIDSKMGGLYALKVLCDNELEKRAEGDVRKSYVTLFGMMQQELEQYSANPATTIASTLVKKIILGPVSDAMPDILKDAEALNEHQPDACIRLAIERQIEKKSAELSKVEEMITKIGPLLREAGTLYKQASSIDYRTIMLPFMKSFIQLKLEPLVFEAAKQKADSMLSQLEPSQGGSPVKPQKGDPKGKQHKKDKKKATADKEEAKDSKERKLQEELAHQKTVEDDVTQKALAKQNKNAATLTPEKMDKVVVVWPTARDDEGPDGSNAIFYSGVYLAAANNQYLSLRGLLLRRWDYRANREIYSGFRRDGERLILSCPFVGIYLGRHIIVGSVKGLWCYKNIEALGCPFSLWNPSIRRHFCLPSPLTSDSPHDTAVGFGYVSRFDDYKVVVVSYPLSTDEETSEAPSVHVFSLKLRTWKMVPATHVDVQIVESSRQAFIGTTIYWVAVDYKQEEASNTRKLILRFDLVEEVFSKLYLPPQIAGIIESSMDLDVFEGKLTAFHYTDGLTHRNFSVWVMDHGSWQQMYAIDDVLGFQRAIGWTGSHILIVCHADRWYKLLCFDPHTSRVFTLGIIGADERFYLSTYVETLHLQNPESSTSDGVGLPGRDDM